MELLFVGDIIESNGKTIRENNMARGHKIPLGTLVEAFSEEPDLEYEWEGIRLYVTQHQRDCDGSPLYGLGEKGGTSLLNGFGEDSLREVSI